MISPAGNFKFYVASKPLDFRKGMDGLAAIVQNEFDLDPFSGAIFIFRSKRADRLKLIVWDGTGLVMTYKRIEGKGFEGDVKQQLYFGDQEGKSALARLGKCYTPCTSHPPVSVVCVGIANIGY